MTLGTVAKRSPLTKALLVMLRGLATPDTRPIRVGDHHASTPAAPTSEPELPYAVLYAVSSTVDGPYGDHHADGRFVYQVTSVGTNAGSAEALADLIRDGILAQNPSGYVQPITLTGAAVMSRDLESGGPATQFGDRWNVVDHFALSTTPQY